MYMFASMGRVPSGGGGGGGSWANARTGVKNNTRHTNFDKTWGCFISSKDSLFFDGANSLYFLAGAPCPNKKIYIFNVMKNFLYLLILVPALSLGQSSKSTANGFVQNQFPSGAVQSEGLIMDGQKEGLWIYFFPDGAVRSEKTYTKGLLNGPEIWFHPNGQIGWQEFYKNGAAHGVFSYFDAAGNLTLKKRYINGVEQPFDSNGMISMH